MVQSILIDKPSLVIILIAGYAPYFIYISLFLRVVSFEDAFVGRYLKGGRSRCYIAGL